MARTEVTGKQIKDQSVDLAVDVTGVLPVANGGTGSSSLTLNNVLLGNGTGALQSVSPGTAGNVLTSNGSTWVSAVPAAAQVTLNGSETLSNKTLTSPVITGTPVTTFADTLGGSTVGRKFLQDIPIVPDMTSAGVSGGATIVGTHNNLMWLTERGGTVTVTKNDVDVTEAVGAANWFRPGGYTNLSVDATTDVYVITIAVTGMTGIWGSGYWGWGQLGLNFRSGFHSKDVKLEVDSGGVWTTLLDVTNDSATAKFARFQTLNPPYAQQFRITLTNHQYVNATGLRIQNVWATLLSGNPPLTANEIHLPRSGGAIIGTSASPPTFTATGSDADISINLVPKGTGTVKANNVDLVTTSGVQTLTNKTINSATINSPTLVNLTFSGTTTNSVTIGPASANAHVYLAGPPGLPTYLAYAQNAGSYSYLSTAQSGVLASMSGDLIVSSRAAGKSIVFGTTTSGNTDVERMRIASDGTVTIGGAAAVTTTSTQTLTNKTISGASNTLSDIPQSAVTSLTTDLGTAQTAAGTAQKFIDLKASGLPNLASDPSCSTPELWDTNGFGSNWTGEISTDQAASGTTSLKMTITGSAYPSLTFLRTSTGNYVPDADSLKVRPGDKFYMEAYIRAHPDNVVTDKGLYIQAWSTDSTGVNSYAFTNNVNTIPTSTEWTKITHTYTVPAGRDRLNVRIAGNLNHGIGDVYYIDKLLWLNVTDTQDIIDNVYQGINGGTSTWNSLASMKSSLGTVVTLTGSQSLTNKTLTTPTITTPTVRGFLLKDSNDNNIAAHSNAAVGTGTSYLSLAPGTGSPGPSVTATSSETNTGLVFWTKGTGLTQFRSNANSGQSVALRLVPHASGVNWLDIANAPSGSSPTLKSVSYGNTDTNVGLNLEALGSGMISLKSDNVHVSGGSVTSLKVDSEGTSGRSELLLNDDGDTKAYVQWRGSTNPAIPNTLRIQTNTGVTGDIVIGDQGASRIFIAGGQNGLTAGRVGIGTATPSSTLDVNGEIRQQAVPVVTTTGSQTLTNKTISGANNTFSSIPATAVPGAAQYVRAHGSVAGQWYRIFTFSPPGNPFFRFSAVYAISCFSQGGAVIGVHIGNWGENSVGGNVEFIGKGTLPLLARDSFKLVGDGYGQPFELWVKTTASGSALAYYEVSRYGSGYTTYDTSNTPQATEPVGQVLNVKSSGLASLDVGSGDQASTATPAYINLGGTYGNSTPGSSNNLKLRLFDNGTGSNHFGLGVSDAKLEYQVPSTSTHRFYVGGTERLTVSSSAVQVGGVDVVTTTAAQTLTNKTLNSATINSPTIGSPTMQVVKGINGGTVLYFADGGPGTNYLSVVNRAPGYPPYFRADGSDTNIDMMLVPKGSGGLQLYAGTTSPFQISVSSANTNQSINIATKGSGTVNANGIPVVTTTAAQTLTNKTLTTPVINGLPTGTGVSSAATGNTLAARDSAGDTTFRYLHAVWVSNSHAVVTRNSDTAFYSTNDNYIRKNTATGFKTSLALNNVDNTSDATKNSAVATLTNKTLTSPTISTPTINGTTTISGDVTVDNGTSSLVVIRSDDTGTSGLLLRGQSQGTSYVEVTQDGSYGGGMSFFGGGGSTFATGESTDSVTFYRKGAGTRTAVFGYGWNSNNVNFAGNIAVAGNITSGGIAVPTISSSSTLTNKTISGSSNTLTNISISSLSNAPSLFNNMGEVHQQRTSFDAQGAASTVDFGWRYVQGSINGPGTNSATQYYSQFIGLGSNYAYNTYGMQIAYPRNVTSPYISIRYQEGSVFGSWRKISAGYADSAGDADTLDGQHASAFVTPSGTATLTNKTITSPTFTGTAIGPINVMSNLINLDDWNSSPISIRERQGVANTNLDDKYSPNLNFHWASRVSNSLWMNTNGQLNWGSYSATGVPAANGTINAGTFVGNLNGNATTASSASSITGGIPNNSNYEIRARVIRNSNSTTSNDGLYIGYGNTNGGDTRLYGGGNTTNPVSVSNGGTLTVPGVVASDEVRCITGQQLVFNAGESRLYYTSQTSEKVYLNAEQGIEIVSSPDNWASGWAGRNTATICNNDGVSSFPGNIYINGVIVPTISSTHTLTNKTLTSPTISDPVINGNATGTAISTANTANTLVKRDGNGDFSIRYVFSSYLNMSHGVSGTTNDTIFYSSKDNYIRKNNASGFKSSLGLNNVDNTSDATKNSATATLTNKRITPRIGSVTSTATPSINADIYDQYNITALATNITSVTITGTPTDGQKLMLRIKDNGTARAITWGASFVSSGTATLLTTTVVNKTHLVGLLYDSAAAKWVCIAADSLGY